MYLQLDDYPPYSEERSEIFEKQVHIKLRCIYGYTNCFRHTDSITWVSIDSWEMLHFEFSHAERISVYPRTTICDKCDQSNMRGGIFNAGDNVDD